MINYYFQQPIYISDFDSSLIELDYSTHRLWESNTITSWGNKNNLSNKSHIILVKKLAEYTKQVIMKEHKIVLHKIWVNEYEKKDFQETHFHPKSHFSFCIIHKLPENSGHLKFLNPYEDFGYEHYNIFFKYYKFNETPAQKENTILIWPSYIKHLVTPGNNKTKRITYSGNFNIKI